MRQLLLYKPAVTLLLAILVSLTGLTSCFSPVPAATSIPSATGTRIETPVGIEPPVAGEQVLTIAGGTNDPPTLDPALARDAESAFYIRQLYSGLVSFDDNMNLVPDIAESMPDVSADGRTFTFHLRKGVQFQNGDEVTAEDFKYSLERATDPALAAPNPGTSLPAGTYLNDIVGVTQKLKGESTQVAGVVVKDKYTLEITIDEPKAYFLSKLANVTAFVVNKKEASKGGLDWTEHPGGAGPFVLSEWRHGELMVLKRNDHYHLGAPRLEKINILLGVAATQPMNQYEKGVLDITDVPLGDIDRVSDKTNPLSAELSVVPELSTTYVGFNVKMKPFDDPKIRQALAHAIDKAKVVEVKFQEKVRKADGMVPPDMPGFSSAPEAQGFDLTLSRQLIAESSYKDAKNVPRITIYTPDDSLAELLYQVFRQGLGIEVEIRQLQWQDFLAGLNRHEFQSFVLSWEADYPDPQNFLEVLFASNGPDNYSGYASETVDQMLSEAATDQDQAGRSAIYREVEEQVLRDSPVIPLFHNVRYVLMKKYVQGVEVTPMGILTLRNAWISKAQN